ncbi:serine/threonine-protein kinase sepA-like isoform 2 [Planoprotostelium fungivorum]|uniref:non-specific serine/threonine protein kinase n=1 Tax=Planoprotostelium fungivorum TaxID=1890364 RepID=A0A2P6NF23_9EUKA|nr:serine/threonine-protein kinase sepA-like isoform 2 [Planoprotostelium fungivorum]
MSLGNNHTPADDSRTVIDNYQLGEILGKGAMGTVYRALNLDDGSTVALKRIPCGKNSRAIMKEINLMRGFSHDKIVGYFGCLQTTNHLNIILEYVENGSLQHLLKKFGVLPERLVVRYMDQVLEGLAYLHANGVVHRDVKAGNILLTKTGAIKLTDFGISTSLVTSKETKEPTNKVEFEPIGSPFWINLTFKVAPEIIQLMEGSETNTLSDIWSVGCTMIELLTLYPPYWDLGKLPAMFAMVEDERPPLPGNITPECSNFLKRCFTKDPKGRPTAANLRLDPWLQRKVEENTEGSIRSPVPRKIPSINEMRESLKELNKSTSATKKLPLPSPIDITESIRATHISDTKSGAAMRLSASQDNVGKVSLRSSGDRFSPKKSMEAKPTSKVPDFISRMSGGEAMHLSQMRSRSMSVSAVEIVNPLVTSTNSLRSRDGDMYATEDDLDLPAYGHRKMSLSESMDTNSMNPVTRGSVTDEDVADRLNFEKILSIQRSFHGTKVYIRDGPLLKVCRKAKKPRWFFLFNDCIIYCSTANAKKRVALPGTFETSTVLNTRVRFNFHRLMPLTDTRIKSLNDLPEMENAFVFVTPLKSFIVLSDSKEEKEAWLRDVTRCIDKLPQKKNHSSGGTTRSTMTTSPISENSSVINSNTVASSIIKLNESTEEEEVPAAPVWVNIDASPHCLNCKKAFGIFNRKHNCRSCGLLVCSSCSQQKTYLPHVDTNQRVRVCPKCMTKLAMKRLTDTPPALNSLRPNMNASDSSLLKTATKYY